MKLNKNSRIKQPYLPQAGESRNILSEITREKGLQIDHGADVIVDASRAF